MSTCFDSHLQELRSSVEKFNTEPQKVGSPSLGDVVRQGDIYLVCIDCLPSKGKDSDNRQLAPGNTQGSRHILSGDVKIVSGHKTEYHEALSGPAFQCVGDVTVTHPEHTHVVLPKDTCWQVVYQVAYDEEIRRVQD